MIKHTNKKKWLQINITCEFIYFLIDDVRVLNFLCSIPEWQHLKGLFELRSVLDMREFVFPFIIKAHKVLDPYCVCTDILLLFCPKMSGQPKP